VRQPPARERPAKWFNIACALDAFHRPGLIGDPTMSLTEEQKQKVADWIEDGAKPADVQSRLEAEFNLRVTYMEVRFLIDDLKVMPKDPTPPPVESPAEGAATDFPENPLPDEAGAQPQKVMEEGIPFLAEGEAGASKVDVQVDSITRPGAMVSGHATMSDGKKVDWYLDQYGRLGMVPPEPGYRPAQNDLIEFQAALEKELMKQGF